LRRPDAPGYRGTHIEVTAYGISEIEGTGIFRYPRTGLADEKNVKVPVPRVIAATPATAMGDAPGAYAISAACPTPVSGGLGAEMVVQAELCGLAGCSRPRRSTTSSRTLYSPRRDDHC
jgi:hypothetical protein